MQDHLYKVSHKKVWSAFLLPLKSVLWGFEPRLPNLNLMGVGQHISCSKITTWPSGIGHAYRAALSKMILEQEVCSMTPLK